MLLVAQHAIADVRDRSLVTMFSGLYPETDFLPAIQRCHKGILQHRPSTFHIELLLVS